MKFRHVVLLTLFLLLCPVGVITFWYLCCPVYEYAPKQPFSGQSIFNPYADFASAIPLKANFHAHSAAWGGLTAGNNAAEAVLEHYRYLDYDIPVISNYQSISRHNHEYPLYIPTYEHGYGIFKFHLLCIGADRVIWHDFPLWNTIDNKQYILDRCQSIARVVVICHPTFTKFLSLEDISRLSNYDLIEVTRGTRLTTEHWDAALSAGRLVFGMSNDDSKCLSREQDYLRRYNLVFVREQTVENVYQSLQNGKIIAILVPVAHDLEQRREISKSVKELLDNIDFDQDTLSVSLNHPAKRIAFIGQNGTVRKEQHDTEQGEYVFTPEDTYIRTEIEFHSGIIFLLNPLVRYDGCLEVYRNLNHISWSKTIFYVTIRFIVFGIIVYFGFRICFGFRFGTKSIQTLIRERNDVS